MLFLKSVLKYPTNDSVCYKNELGNYCNCRNQCIKCLGKDGDNEEEDESIRRPPITIEIKNLKGESSPYTSERCTKYPYSLMPFNQYKLSMLKINVFY